MQRLGRQATALCVEADLQVLGGETSEVTPRHSPTRDFIVVTGIITCSAIFSLLEARGQLRWEAATSASTVSVWVHSKVRRLGCRAEGCRTQDRRTEEEEAEMLLRKKRPRGTQAHPPFASASPPPPSTCLTGGTGAQAAGRGGREGWSAEGRRAGGGADRPSPIQHVSEASEGSFSLGLTNPNQKRSRRVVPQ